MQWIGHLGIITVIKSWEKQLRDFPGDTGQANKIKSGFVQLTLVPDQVALRIGLTNLNISTNFIH